MPHSGESGCHKKWVADALTPTTDEHLGSVSAPGEFTVSPIDFSVEGHGSRDLFPEIRTAAWSLVFPRLWKSCMVSILRYKKYSNTHYKCFQR